MEIILQYKAAFSLRDEIGECPNIRIDIDVIDDTPFFVRPFPISEEDKPIMDKQMQRLVSVKILSKIHNKSHFSSNANHKESNQKTRGLWLTLGC